MTDDLAEQVANLPDKKKIEFLLNFAGNLAAERDRLAGIIVEIYGKISYTGVYSPYSVVDECDLMPSAIGQIIAQRDRLRAVVEAGVAVLGAEWLDFDDSTRWLSEARRLLDGGGVMGVEATDET